MTIIKSASMGTRDLCVVMRSDGRVNLAIDGGYGIQVHTADLLAALDAVPLSEANASIEHELEERDHWKARAEAAEAKLAEAERTLTELAPARDDRVIAWEAIAHHEAFRPCYDEERPLLDAVLDRIAALLAVEAKLAAVTAERDALAATIERVRDVAAQHRERGGNKDLLMAARLAYQQAGADLHAALDAPRAVHPADRGGGAVRGDRQSNTRPGGIHYHYRSRCAGLRTQWRPGLRLRQGRCPGTLREPPPPARCRQGRGRQVSAERDELAAVVDASRTRRVHYDGDPYGSVVICGPEEIADAILAAGYRKPRQVTTAAELWSMPVGSVVLDSRGNAFQRVYSDEPAGLNWYGVGVRWGSTASEITLPVTVLHEGYPDA